MLRAVEPLEHVSPVPCSLLETSGWQAKEVLVCGQDTIEVGDCNVKMVNIEVEGIASATRVPSKRVVLGSLMGE